MIFKSSKKIDQICIFISDRKLIKLYHNLKIFIKNKNHLLLNANEKAKDFSMIAKYLKSLHNFKLNKSFKIYAIGGGVIQDISCFLASIYFRGIKWYFIPTTLEAQGDSCIEARVQLISEKKSNWNILSTI